MALFDVRQLRTPARSRPALVPAGYEALADALTLAGDPLAAAEEIGGRVAAEGAPLDDLLADVARTYDAVLGSPEPAFDVVRAAATSWSDSALRYLHGVACEDPLTGLSSLAHVRTRLADIYRGRGRDGAADTPAYALVVVDVGAGTGAALRFERELELVDLADQLRTVFSGDETIGRLAGGRAVALVRRDRHLGGSVRALRMLLTQWRQRGGPRARVWIEGLPAGGDGAVALLDELAR